MLIVSVMSSYAGDVTPQAAYEALAADSSALLVDVRTAAEWTYVGLPDLSAIHRDVTCIEWQTFPEGDRNTHFLDQLRDAATPELEVFFLCRSGVRSRAAAEAATAAGFEHAYNIIDGFEGPLDVDGKRTVSGWKNEGMPWRQG